MIRGLLNNLVQKSGTCYCCLCISG